ncbi:hypothetical protein LCGC14_2279620, partial [marine sediment metagenome]
RISLSNKPPYCIHIDRESLTFKARSTIDFKNIGPSALLIVDDICDTGNSMKEVVDEYKARGHEVLTFALYYKETSVFTPDFIWQTIHEDAPWVHYPWEQVS